MEAQPFVMERIINVPSAKVWKALTDTADMKQWYFNLTVFKPEPGFGFRFEAGEPGNLYLHICKVTEVIPGKKLAYSWRYDGYAGDSLVSFELFEEGDTTRLRLTHEGLETFPASNPDLAKENFAAGWNQIIGKSLKDFLEPAAV